MEKERLFKIFSQYHPVSEAFKMFMETALVQEDGIKGHKLLSVGEVPANCWFMIKGSARVYMDTPSQQTTIWYWHTDQMIYSHSGFCTQTPSEENIELLEDSVFFSLAYTAIPKLIKLFPWFYKIESRLKELHQQDLLEQSVDLKTLDAEQRFAKLFRRFPALMNTNFKKDIASYLGMDPDTLNRLRGKK
ncbi:Crp/Fnr family transcriptional regulator [Pedobacter sp. PAMC26386]|nr:Crp/Fnr family transcriptional regulator [Pedobacter sp. PAMC26386]